MLGATISGPIASIFKHAISFNGQVPFVGNARFPRLYCLLKQTRSRLARYEFAAAALAKIAALATKKLNSRAVLSNDPLRAPNASIHFLPTGLIPNADPREIIVRLTSFRMTWSTPSPCDQRARPSGETAGTMGS